MMRLSDSAGPPYILVTILLALPELCSHCCFLRHSTQKSLKALGHSVSCGIRAELKKKKKKERNYMAKKEVPEVFISACWVMLSSSQSFLLWTFIIQPLCIASPRRHDSYPNPVVMMFETDFKLSHVPFQSLETQHKPLKPSINVTVPVRSDLVS